MALAEAEGARVRLGGRPLAWHQLHALLALGCERVVCLAEAPGAVLAGLQREAEAAGAKFHAIAQSRALSGLVSAADTLFVIAPGVLPERDWLLGALGARAGVAVLPAERALEQGFERIDRERAWGGVLATRGDAVEALAALPADADPIAGLLRVALHRAARCVEVPSGWLDDGRWALVNDSTTAARLELAWQARHVPSPPLGRPGEALAHRIARMLSARAADRPALRPLALIGGLALALAGGIAGYLGHTTGGLAALAGGALAAEVGVRLEAFARAGTGPRPGGRVHLARDALLDLSLIAIAASPREFADWPVAYAAAVLVAALRLARQADEHPPLRPVGDRVLIFSLLTLAAGAGWFAPALALLGGTALALRLFWPQRRG
ncbi:MAG: hypothetical protein ACEQR8_07860 [Cypionkella sp.]